MIRISMSVLAILSLGILLRFAYSLPKDQLLMQGLVMVVLVALVSAIFYFDLIENIGDTIWGAFCAVATIWSGVKMIESIDFDKPFLLSFYWSTLGFLLLALFCLLFTVAAFVSAARKRD